MYITEIQLKLDRHRSLEVEDKEEAERNNRASLIKNPNINSYRSHSIANRMEAL